MNPYETLGVERAASAEQIKRAYRRLAKKHHPDSGGDERTMGAIIQAYAILSNPERKKLYDETGKTEADRGIQGDVLAQFGVFAEQMLFQRDDINVSKCIAETEKQIAQQAEGEKQRLDAERKKLISAQDRILSKPENDFLGAIIAGRLADLDRSQKLLERKNEVARLALEMLKGYTFKEPEPRKSIFEQMGMGTSASTTGW